MAGALDRRGNGVMTDIPSPSPSPFVHDPRSPQAVAEFLDRCEADLVHPEVVADRLRRQGWSDLSAAQVADHYRRRFDEHALGYSALLVCTGLSALAAGTAAHQLLGIAEGIDVDREGLALWLTVLVVATPLAAWATVWAHRVDRDDPVAVWSRPRRSLARVLLWSCAVVGGCRLLAYVFNVIATIAGSQWASDRSLLIGFAHVAVTIGITYPLGRWAHGFLHRFDAEDPTAPRRRSRREQQARSRRTDIRSVG